MPVCAATDTANEPLEPMASVSRVPVMLPDVEQVARAWFEKDARGAVEFGIGAKLSGEDTAALLQQEL